MPKYYVLKDGEMYTMMFGCTSVIFSHQPSLGAGNPLTAGYCRQGVQVYSKSPILAVTFYFQSIFFQDSVHFCQLTTRSHLVLELRWIWWSANWDLRQGYLLLPLPQTGTYFEERLWCVVLFINFKTSNVLSNFNVLFWYFENRGTVLNLVPHLCVCVCTHISMTYYV